MHALTPITVGRSKVANRLMFGPHVTNLGDLDRSFTDRHVAYYQRRAAGGCGIIVTEGASVHASDWPYERAPLATQSSDGWAAIAAACHRHGTLVIASLDHAGGQGSSAYSQRELWAPSRVPEVATREVPKWMEPHDIAAVIDGFAVATRAAVEAGCDGVEINAGQHSIVRQFLSGLTNHRGDEWGADRLLFARRIIEVVRAAAGDAIVALRLSADELAPWAGITPDMAPGIAAELCAAGAVDLLTVVRGSIFSIEKTRPDFHEPAGHNIDVCRAIRDAVPRHTLVALQGSIVDPAQAEWALTDGVADLVEMTRAQIADPDLVSKLAAGEMHQVRPCIRCNQTCQVRDARSPVVTCVGEPSSGHEHSDPDWYMPASHPRRVTIVGGGVAGLEAARVAARRGHTVHLIEQSDALGGTAAVAGPGAPLVDWLVGECERAGVEVSLRTTSHGDHGSDAVIECTGSVPGVRSFHIDPDAVVLDVLDVRRGASLPDGRVALFDPIGGPIAVALAEELADRAILITQDQIAGNELSRTGDLAPANSRLAQRGVQIERRSILRSVHSDHIELEDRFSGERRTVLCSALVDCGFRLPAPPLVATNTRAGDAVAPRTILEAILEARRAAASL